MAKLLFIDAEMFSQGLTHVLGQYPGCAAVDELVHVGLVLVTGERGVLEVAAGLFDEVHDLEADGIEVHLGCNSLILHCRK